MCNDSLIERADGDFKPSRFMRARRPYLYSDSTKVTRRAVTREMLSHHLETLTSRKEEATFEIFVRRLAERFIAPNLVPQTGPTGGGDGKTDAETYPVATAIALRWYVPNAAPAHERWAFAFSAKKEWRDKVRDDVAEIVATGRGYPKIIFITNQSVAAKKRSAEQDALEKKYGVPVTILDRTWILEHVFNRDSLDIAVEVLGVGAGTEHMVDIIGSEDRKRFDEFQPVEKAIADGANYAGTPHALVEDCHRVAVLARGLGKPQPDVDGRFLRAVKLARRHKLSKLELAAQYDWAWTSFFWFDDVSALNAKYDEVEALALSSDSAEDLERLVTLLTLIRNSIASAVLTADNAKLATRGAALLTALRHLEADTSRPNNALHARALLLQLQLVERKHNNALADRDDLSDLWDQFRDVIEASNGLGTFPFEPLADLLTEIGEFIPESPAFDRLYETLTDRLATRASEGEAAERNAARAYQKLEKDLPYEAIRWFGRAVGLLTKAEYQEQLLLTLVGSSLAYTAAGLPWAARNYALAAFAQQCSTFSRSGSPDDVNPATLGRLFEAEVQLGRVPYLLHVFYLWRLFSGARATTEARRQQLQDRQLDFDGSLSALLMKAPFDELPTIANLPDALERMGLAHARTTLLFLMGGEDVLRADLHRTETAQIVVQHFERVATVGQQIAASQPDYQLDKRVRLNARILGCNITITCANTITSIAIAEALLGTLEALLATSLEHRILPHLDRLELRLEPRPDAAVRPALNFVEERGNTVGVIVHATQLDYRTREDVVGFPAWLRDSAVQVFLKFAIPADHEAWTQAVLEAEQGFTRAITFSHVPSAMSIIFGSHQERLSIRDWIEDRDAIYARSRTTPWCPKAESGKSQTIATVGFAEHVAPAGTPDLARTKHSDVRTISPIDVHKWDAAKWRAAFFMTVSGAPHIPPVLGLCFRNAEPAAAIFQGLHTRFGRDDTDNALRIAIIRGVRASNPHAYAVIVGPNIDVVPVDTTTLFQFVSRVHIMTPASSLNLDRFLAEFARHGRYVLIAAHLPNVNGPPEPIKGTELGKHHLALRQAWQIGVNDPDIVALDSDEPPVIPPEQTDAPVLKVIKHRPRKAV